MYSKMSAAGHSFFRHTTHPMTQRGVLGRLIVLPYVQDNLGQTLVRIGGTVVQRFVNKRNVLLIHLANITARVLKDARLPLGGHAPHVSTRILGVSIEYSPTT